MVSDTEVPTSPSSARKTETVLPDGLPVPRRYWSIATMTLGIIITVFDASMSNVALPAISAALQIPASLTVWVVLAYSLTMVGSMLPFAALAERVGFKLLYAVGMTIFLVATVSSAMSDDMMQLVISRIGQGLGSAMLMCQFGGIVRNSYPMSQLGAGLSFNAFVVGISSVLGPTIGAMVLQWFSWPVIFLVNIPLALLSYLGIRHLPDIPRRSGPFDWWACALSAVVFALALYGLDTLGREFLNGLFFLAISAFLAWVLVRRSWVQPAPVVPVDLLRVRTIGYAVAASAFFFASQMGAFVALPFYFKSTYAASYAQVGLYLGAWAMGASLMAPVAGYMSARYPVAILCIIGASIMALGISGVLVAPAGMETLWLPFSMLMAGIGYGFFQTPNNRAMLGSIPSRRSGAGGGMQATTRVFGQGVGTALVGLMFQISTEHGATLGVLICVVSVLIALAINVARHFDRRPDTRLERPTP